MCRLLIPPGNGNFRQGIEMGFEKNMELIFVRKNYHGPPIGAGGDGLSV